MASGNGKNAWKNRIVGYGEEAPDQLLANPMNFRVHPKDQQSATEGSLDTLGWIDDVIVNKTTGHVVDGHLRVTLAMRNNEPTVPVKYVELTESEEYQALLSLDPIAAMAATDKAKLDEVLHGVNSDDKRVQEFIAELAKREGLQYGAPAPDDPGAQIDKAEELREKWGVNSGQIWRLGSHRLICGDCTDKATVERVMQGEKAQLFFTDPPYGMDKGFENDELKDGDLTTFNDKWIPLFIGDDNAIFISFHSPRLFWTVLDSARNNGWKLGRYFAFYKPNDMTFPWHSWITTSESILLFLRGKPKFNNEKPADTHFWHDTYTWNHKGMVEGETKLDGQALSHPSIKPIPVCQDLIWKTSFEGDLVYEPFSGSGTTLIACERLGRKCRAVEISPAYCAVAIQRWVDMTGGIPELVK